MMTLTLWIEGELARDLEGLSLWKKILESSAATHCVERVSYTDALWMCGHARFDRGLVVAKMHPNELSSIRARWHGCQISMSEANPESYFILEPTRLKGRAFLIS
jgi:hypothetical protein